MVGYNVAKDSAQEHRYDDGGTGCCVDLVGWPKLILQRLTIYWAISKS